MRFRAIIGLMSAAAVAAVSILLSPVASSTGSCAGAAAGGDWRSYGHDLSNTRTQPEEDLIGPANAGALQKDFVFSTSAVVGGGVFSSTPNVADGCVYIGSDTGWVFAFNADDGTLVWSTKYNGTVIGGGFVGGLIVGSPAVADGKVFVLVSNGGNPYAVALNQADGTELWNVPVGEAAQAHDFINSSPVYFEDMLLVGVSGLESSADARGLLRILNADTGATLATAKVIPDDDYASGYKGGSIWATPAVDPATKYAYVGTGNPSSKEDPGLEHPRSNAILKIDVDPARATFGEIVDSYKGDPDSYIGGLNETPLCETLGDKIFVLNSWSVPCGQLDLDFGSSPNLVPGGDGQLLVVELQKSGKVHAVKASDLEPAWTSIVGGPGVPFNADSHATDGSSIYVVGSPPGQMFSLGAGDGAPAWASPVGDGAHYDSVSYANGVVYTIDNGGFLDAWDAQSGIPLLRRNVALDTPGNQNAAGISSTGVAIARNTVYVAAARFVLAYRLL